MNYKNKEETSSGERKQAKLSKAFYEKSKIISKFKPTLAIPMSRINIFKKLNKIRVEQSGEQNTQCRATEPEPK